MGLVHCASEAAVADGKPSIQALLDEATQQARQRKSNKARAKKAHQKATVAIVGSHNGTSAIVGTTSNPDGDTTSSDDEDAAFINSLDHANETETRLMRKLKRLSIETPEDSRQTLSRYKFVDGLTSAKEQQVRDRAQGKEVVASYRRKGDRKQDKR